MTAVFDPERERRSRLAQVEVVRVTPRLNPVRSIEDRGLIEGLEARFSAAVQMSERLSRLALGLQDSGRRYCVFGGWVRDTISALRGKSQASPARDIDVVVHGTDLKELSGLMPPDVRRTIFGGIQSEAPPLAFDVWPLQDTFLIAYLGLPPSFESLLESTDFTINAALFFPRQGDSEPELWDRGMAEALATKTLAFNNAALPLPIMQCARLLAYAGKLSLEPSPAARGFVRELVSDPARREQVLAGLGSVYSPTICERARKLLLEWGT